MYDFKESKNRVISILTSPTKIVEKDKIPLSDSDFTYSNGIKTWVSAIFVDIVGSSRLFQNPDENTARIIRSFCSEIIAILKENDNYREIGIRGDCVYAIYTTQFKEDIVSVFENAYRINTFMKMFNILLKKYNYTTISAGIGLGCSQDLIVKAGHVGSGINDKIWIGKAVVDACHLADKANRNDVNAIAMSPMFYGNVIDILEEANPNYKFWIKEYKATFYSEKFYHCNIIQTDFDKWIEEGGVLE